MEVYLEIVILDNFIITAYIVKCVYYLLKRKESNKRILLGCVVATTVAVLYPLIEPQPLIIATKSLLFVILCLIFFAGNERFFLASGLFLAVTACLGGIVFALSFVFAETTVEILGKNYYGFPLSLVVGGCVLGCKLIRKCTTSLRKMSSKIKYGCKFSVTIDKKSVIMYGLIDTGNSAFDNESGLPIVLMSLKSILKITSRERLVKILGVEQRKVEIFTATGSEKISVIKPDKFVLYFDGGVNRIVEVVIGVSIANLKCDALLHSSFLEHGEQVC